MERKTYTAPDSFAIGLSTEGSILSESLPIDSKSNVTSEGGEYGVYSSREIQPTGGGAGLWENMGK